MCARCETYGIPWMFLYFPEKKKWKLKKIHNERRYAWKYIHKKFKFIRQKWIDVISKLLVNRMLIIIIIFNRLSREDESLWAQWTKFEKYSNRDLSSRLYIFPTPLINVRLIFRNNHDTGTSFKAKRNKINRLEFLNFYIVCILIVDKVWHARLKQTFRTALQWFSFFNWKVYLLLNK